MPEASTNAAKLMGAEDYATKYLVDMEFERDLITARQDRCLEFLDAHLTSTLLEVGCGPNLLIDRFDLPASSIQTWMVVEPSFYADDIEAKMAECDKLALTRGYMEDHVEALTAAVPGGFDAVMLSGLLHETTNPAAMLSASYALLRKGGHLFVSVPNALSFHRLLAVEMGMMDSATQLSARNVELGQPVVYQRDTLETLVRQAGFEALEFSGYMFKPFSNAQMGTVIDALGTDMVDGLNKLGRLFPDNAAEIAVVAQKL